MIFVLLLCVGLAHAGTLQKRVTYDLKNASDHFETFIQQFNKQYESESEKQRRFDIFKENLKHINEMNNNPNETVQFDTMLGLPNQTELKYIDFERSYNNTDVQTSLNMSINQFADLTSEEFSSRYGGCAKTFDTEDIDGIKINKPKGIEVAEAIDWSSRLPPAKDQGRCSSCWAFGTVGAIEGNFNIKYGTIASFSEQQLLDCSDARGCGHNEGLITPYAAAYIIQAGGIMSDMEYPYSAQKRQCQFRADRVMGRLNRYDMLNLTNNEQLTKEYLQYGPITIQLNSYPLQLVTGPGIYRDCAAGFPDHAVVLVGYGNENGEPYWLIRNSWGTSWGQQGYLKIARNGPACGLLNHMAVKHYIA